MLNSFNFKLFIIVEYINNKKTNKSIPSTLLLLLNYYTSFFLDFFNLFNIISLYLHTIY